MASRANNVGQWTSLDPRATFEFLDGERNPETWNDGFHFQHDMYSLAGKPIYNRIVILPVREWMIKYMVGNTQIIIVKSMMPFPAAFRFERIEDATFFKLRWGQDIVLSRDI